MYGCPYDFSSDIWEQLLWALWSIDCSFTCGDPNSIISPSLMTQPIFTFTISDFSGNLANRITILLLASTIAKTWSFLSLLFSRDHHPLCDPQPQLGFSNQKCYSLFQKTPSLVSQNFPSLCCFQHPPDRCQCHHSSNQKTSATLLLLCAKTRKPVLCSFHSIVDTQTLPLSCRRCRCLLCSKELYLALP